MEGVFREYAKIKKDGQVWRRRWKGTRTILEEWKCYDPKRSQEILKVMTTRRSASRWEARRRDHTVKKERNHEGKRSLVGGYQEEWEEEII